MNTHIKETIESINNIIDTKKKGNYNLETEELYQTLLNKEEKVLDLINDIHMNKLKSKSELESFVSSPLHVIVFKTFKTLSTVLSELMEVSNVYEVVDILVKKEYSTYIGIVFVFFAIILMFVTL